MHMQLHLNGKYWFQNLVTKWTAFEITKKKKENITKSSIYPFKLYLFRIASSLSFKENISYSTNISYPVFNLIRYRILKYLYILKIKKKKIKLDLRACGWVFCGPYALITKGCPKHKSELKSKNNGSRRPDINIRGAEGQGAEGQRGRGQVGPLLINFIFKFLY